MRRLEQRGSLLAIGIAVAVYVIMLAVAGPFFRSFDEAKYLGIGYGMLAGNGPRTVFGAIFLPHSPLWPMIMAAPDVWFHMDPFAWGQILNGIAGASLLLLVGWLGWQIRPVIGALAVASCLAIPYLHELARTARLDVPAAALSLAYVVVGIAAARRSSVRWGLLAGAIFAVAFLIKEIVLPLAPVPWLVGVLMAPPATTLARTAGAALLVAVAGTAWWFALYAAQTHRIYRLGAPDGWLLPLELAAIGLAVFGLAAPRIGRSAVGRRLAARSDGFADGQRRRLQIILAWGLGLLWTAAFTVFFARNSELKGVGLVSASQYDAYVRTWFPNNVYRLAAVIFVIGAILGLATRRGMSGRAATTWDAIVLALICSMPLVMLVIAVGEPPRNYLAQIGLFAILSTIGWVHAFEWAVEAVGSRLSWRPGAGRLGAAWRPALVAVAVVFGSLNLTSQALAKRETSGGPVAAVDAGSRWIEDHVPPGTRIGFGSYLGYETAVDLAGRYSMVQIHQSLAVVDPTAPLGLSEPGSAPIDDWIALDVSRRVQEFYVFRASVFGAAVKKADIAYYVYLTGPTTSVPALLGSLTADHGFRLVDEATFESVTPGGARSTVRIHIFAVDRARVDLRDSRLFAPPAALDAFVGRLFAGPPIAAATASALAERVTTWPDPAAGGPIVERLAAAGVP